ncbi:hypothetical protein KAR91_51735 [Candidatus Pacearchaeota archaeon]|nr:hypothetical protein [Candidatus Pacearchaeota archaeon]
MKTFERKTEISYNWRRVNDEDIIPEHVEALEEAAQNRIAEMLNQGFTSGELLDTIHMTHSDPENGVEYHGWWETKTLN